MANLLSIGDINPHDEGYAAYYEGVNMDENPYLDRGTNDLALSWAEGWECAENEALEG